MKINQEGQKAPTYLTSSQVKAGEVYEYSGSSGSTYASGKYYIATAYGSLVCLHDGYSVAAKDDAYGWCWLHVPNAELRV